MEFRHGWHQLFIEKDTIFTDDPTKKPLSPVPIETGGNQIKPSRFTVSLFSVKCVETAEVLGQNYTFN